MKIVNVKKHSRVSLPTQLKFQKYYLKLMLLFTKGTRQDLAKIADSKKGYLLWNGELPNKSELDKFEASRENTEPFLKK